MIGNFQKSHLRIEIEASKALIGENLLTTSKLRQWLFPQTLSGELSAKLQPGVILTSSMGLITIQHQVDMVSDNCVRLLLSQGIDGYHEWYWGEGWVQSRLEGISLLPLNLAQTFNLLKFRQFILCQKQTIPS